MKQTSRLTFLLAVLAGGVGCASAPTQVADTQSCDAYAGNSEGETVVVMRDSSSSQKVVVGAPVGINALGDAIVVAGPVVAASNGTGALFASSDAKVEMRPCAPTKQTNQ